MSKTRVHLLGLRLGFWIDGDSELYSDCILKPDLSKPITEARWLLLEDNLWTNAIFFSFIFEMEFPGFLTSSDTFQILA